MAFVGDQVKKRRQHHVWQRYLKSWAVDDKVFCLSEGRIFATDTANVGVERDFYKLEKLTDQDMAVIKMLILDGAHPLAKRNHLGFLQEMLGPIALLELLPTGAGVDEVLNAHMTNALEDEHARVESGFVPVLDRILNGDTSFYEDDQACILFLYFVAMQHMRTKGIRTKTIEVIQCANGIDLSRTWNLLSQMFALQIGATLFRDRKNRKLVLVRNDTGKEFITGDQPTINLHGRHPAPSATLSLYYPVSPRLALFFPEAGEALPVSTGTLTAAQVDLLNRKMVAASHRQVFGRSEACLRPFREAAREPAET